MHLYIWLAKCGEMHVDREDERERDERTERKTGEVRREEWGRNRQRW